MPPSRKSSGSSHNSFGGGGPTPPRRSGGFGSGPSRRPTGSHNSSKNPMMGSFFGGNHRKNANPFGSLGGLGGFGPGSPQYRPVHRRPSWLGDLLMDTILLSGLRHDYTYIPEDYTDTSGKVHKRGYYDEEGTYYKNVGIDNQEVILECPYCGTKTKLVWKSGVLPNCPNCGGTYDVTEDQLGGQSASQSGGQSASQSAGQVFQGSASQSQSQGKTRIPSGLLVVGICIGISFLILLFSLFMGNGGGESSSSYTGSGSSYSGDSSYGSNTYGSNSYGSSTYDTSYQDSYFGDSLYVSELGRSVRWDAENGFYYDPTTGCYFYYNTSVTPPQWTYWFEDIGENYGDYGWMEYDDQEQCWYIQGKNGKWTKLPNRYASLSQLWHMDDAYAAP